MVTGSNGMSEVSENLILKYLSIYYTNLRLCDKPVIMIF